MSDVKYQFKGTPGPWGVGRIDKADPENNNCGCHNVDASIDVWFSDYHKVKSGSEALANAHLIAAAPELLDALKVALWHEENGEAEAQKQGRPRLTERLEIYRAAIHKALNL